MSILTVLGVAVGLSMDAFAVAIASSVTLGKVTGRQLFRLSFHFGLFQAMMPVLGWLAGRSIERWIVQWDHWVAFGLLTLIGGRAIRDALTEKDDDAPADDATRGLRMVGLSIATSIDALAVGLSFAVMDVQIWLPSVIIGITTATITLFGMLMGSRLGSRFGRRVEIFGGLVLIGIGIEILLSHLLH
jgi:putative Mn2+ efflux pump MntP